MCYLLDLHTETTLQNFYARGSIFENMVIAEMLKNRYNQNRPAPFYFWQDNNAVEIDLVVSESAQVNLFEIKSSFTIKSEFWKGITSFRKTIPEHIIRFRQRDLRRKRNPTTFKWYFLVVA